MTYVFSFYHWGYNHKRAVFIVLMALALMLVAGNCFAIDLLAGTTATAKETLNGSIKKYMYITEGILAVAAYIKTKNLLVLPGIAVVAFFMNNVLASFIA